MAEARQVPPSLHQLRSTLLPSPPLPPLKHVSWGQPAPAPSPQLPKSALTAAPTVQQMQSQRMGPAPLNRDYSMGVAGSAQPAGAQLDCGWNDRQSGPVEPHSLLSELWGSM